MSDENGMRFSADSFLSLRVRRAYLLWQTVMCELTSAHLNSAVETAPPSNKAGAFVHIPGNDFTPIQRSSHLRMSHLLLLPCLPHFIARHMSRSVRKGDR